MISARQLSFLIAPALVAAALTFGTGIAVADDDSYLAQIHKIGLTGDKDSLIFADRSAGETPDQMAQVVQSKNPGINLSDATGVVSAAESNYCP